MDIKEISRQITHLVKTKKKPEHATECILALEIVPERECKECTGEKIIRRMWRGVHVETKPCPTCNGTGKLPTITIEQAIKKAQREQTQH